MGCPVARLAQTWPKTFDINENGAILAAPKGPAFCFLNCYCLLFGLHVKNVQKGIFFCDSARSPHRTAKHASTNVP